jgi:hypothetical protein
MVGHPEVIPERDTDLSLNGARLICTQDWNWGNTLGNNLA